VIPELFVEVKVPELDGLVDHLDEELRNAVQIATFRAETAAKIAAPVDTGLLRNSIISYVYGKGSFVSASAFRPGAGFPTAERPRDPWEGIISTGTEYARHVEDGTTRELKDGGTLHIPGRFYMKHAARQLETRIFPQEVDRGIKRAMKRGK
jgi:hypothetical protein